jgi:hypothetical protein
MAPLLPARAAGPNCFIGYDIGDDYTTIAAAIADPGCTTILLDADVYNENLTVDRALAILGPHVGFATINGGGTDRVLTVTTSGDVILSRVYIYNGNHSLGGGIRNEGKLRLSTAIVRDNVSPASQGGGIRNSGILTIENNSSIYNNVSFHGGGIYNAFGKVTISDSSVISNAATNQSGGGVFSSNGPLLISNSNILSNTADGDGAGVCVQSGVLTVTDSLISGNDAGSLDIDLGGGIYTLSSLVSIHDSTITDNNAGRGGGIQVESTGVLIIENTTISDNEATYTDSTGGGLHNSSDMAMLTDVTISGNTAGYAGGGIHNQGPMTLTNVTISGNEARYGGGVNTSGSGVLTVRSSTIVSNSNAGDVGPGGVNNYATVSFQNTIVAYNDSPNCTNADTWTSYGYNIDSANTCSFSSTGDQYNTDPDLAPLADNGGGTMTHALPEGSPAVDAGSCEYQSLDQRGKLRPTDLPGVTNVQDGCDIGAFEIALESFLPLVLRDF